MSDKSEDFFMDLTHFDCRLSCIYTAQAINRVLDTLRFSVSLLTSNRHLLPHRRVISIISTPLV